MVVGVCNHYVAVRSADHTLGVPELPLIRTLRAELKHERSLKVEHLNSMVVAVGDDEMVVLVVYGDTPRHIELPCHKRS